MGNARSGNRILALLLCLLLVLAMLPVGAFAAEIPWEDAYTLTGDALETQTHTIGADWVIIGLSRSGRSIPGDYYELLAANIQETADADNRLHRSKAAENARVILTLTAMGHDATDVEGIDLVAGLNSMDFVKKQGLVGIVWTLIALDCGNYAASGDVTRDGLIQIILSTECSGGGWATSGSYADPDMTGMALQALAPYCGTNPEVKAAADRAVAALSQMQREDGGFATVGLATSESVSQVIVALTALGIDPDTDERFIKNGKSAVDALLSYYAEGGFCHVLGSERDSIATEQGYCALTAYKRFLEGKTSLYDMTDVLDLSGDGNAPVQPATSEPGVAAPPAASSAPTEDTNRFPWWALALATVTVAAVVVILSKKKK